MRKPYLTYAEIPETVSDYILTVAEKRHIMTIPLDEINRFLDDLHEYYKNKQEEYSEGWVD
jgi:hypothetical protein